jgi:hypothetical protein
MSLRKDGFRSGLERSVASSLARRGVVFEYEKHKVEYVSKPHTYTPDLWLPASQIFIEIKGYFKAKDRTKHLRIKEQHPELDLRFVFSNASNRLSKASKTTYGAWCDRHGFLWAEKTVPEEWL